MKVIEHRLREIGMFLIIVLNLKMEIISTSIGLLQLMMMPALLE